MLDLGILALAGASCSRPHNNASKRNKSNVLVVAEADLDNMKLYATVPVELVDTIELDFQDPAKSPGTRRPYSQVHVPCSNDVARASDEDKIKRKRSVFPYSFKSREV